MSNVVLKDKEGNNDTYSNVYGISMLTEDGNEVTFQLASDVTISKSDGVTTIDITDGRGVTQTANINDGYTPVKGVDYFDGEPGKDYLLTEKDKEDIAQLVTVTGNKIYDGILLKDEGNGNVYTLKMVNGTLVTSCDVESLELVTPPDKMEYAIGDEFDPTGMSVKAIFAGGVENDVTNQIEYNAIREEDYGNYIISFMNQTISIPIKVELPDPFADDPAFSNFVYTWDGFENTATITDLKDYTATELIIPDDERIILQIVA